MGGTFQWLLHSFDIKDVQLTSKNLQSNSICEYMHHTVADVLQSFMYSNPLQNLTQARNTVDQAFTTALYVIRVTVATTLSSMPGALPFSWEMFLNVSLIADWQATVHHCEKYFNDNLRHTYQKQLQCNYTPDQQVLKKEHGPTMSGARIKSPYTVQQANGNNMLTIDLCASLVECIYKQFVILYHCIDGGCAYT
jgi:hypothetical protein